ncbi:cupredoxin domain-containing protein [Candidatus Gracilibacteria bacterium]|nr:cupredoxin domain-containing protein [Candidatus Gracilibacteria bacterium]MCF7819560.1 cupredoxin domain-containing protein [Candidatus Gracilibacteria bacterium]
MHKFLFVLGFSLFLFGCTSGSSAEEIPASKPTLCTTPECPSGMEEDHDDHDHDHDAMNNFENEPEQTVSDNESVRTINIDAQRFEFSPNIIRVKKGEKVRLVVNNLDTTHNITIPAFQLGNKSEAIFTADKVGEFEFFCANMCGRGHHEMSGKIIVEE